MKRKEYKEEEKKSQQNELILSDFPLEQYRILRDIECEPRTFNKHTLLSKEHLRSLNMVLFLYYRHYMYALFSQYIEIMSTFNPSLILFAIMKKDYV